jgi:hypothetical protein
LWVVLLWGSGYLFGGTRGLGQLVTVSFLPTDHQLPAELYP